MFTPETRIVSLARPPFPFFFVVAEKRVQTSSQTQLVLTPVNVLINCIINTFIHFKILCISSVIVHIILAFIRKQSSCYSSLRATVSAFVISIMCARIRLQTISFIRPLQIDFLFPVHRPHGYLSSQKIPLFP